MCFSAFLCAAMAFLLTPAPAAPPQRTVALTQQASPQKRMKLEVTGVMLAPEISAAKKIYIGEPNPEGLCDVSDRPHRFEIISGRGNVWTLTRWADFLQGGGSLRVLVIEEGKFFFVILPTGSQFLGAEGSTRYQIPKGEVVRWISPTGLKPPKDLHLRANGEMVINPMKGRLIFRITCTEDDDPE